MLFWWKKWGVRARLCGCCWGSVCEWLPWAFRKTRQRASWSKQLSRNSNTWVFSPWPVLRNIVYTSVILPTPWAHSGPTPTPIPAPCFFLLSLSLFHTFLASPIFFTQAYSIYKQMLPRTSHWWPSQLQQRPVCAVWMCGDTTPAQFIS